MLKKIILFLISLAIGIGIIFYFFEKIGSKEIWEVFLSFPLKGIVLGIVLTFAFIILSSLVWQEIIWDSAKKKISLLKLAPIWTTGFSFAYFTPIAFLGGEVLRAYELKKRFSFSWRGSIVPVFIEKIFEGTIVFLIISFGIFFFLFQDLTLTPKTRFLLLVLLFSLLGTLIFFYTRAFRSKSLIWFLKKPLKKFTSVSVQNGFKEAEEDIFNFFDFKNKYFWRAILGSFLKGIIIWIRTFVILFFLGLPISFLGSLQILAFTYLSYLFPLPAALGSLEAFQVFAFSGFSSKAQSAIAFALISRIFDSGVGLLGLCRAFKIGVIALKKNLFDN